MAMSKLTFHWSSEIYGLGTSFRTVFGIPKFLPLPFFSDHGVITSGIIDESIESYPIWRKTFFTFSESVLELKRNHPSLRILGQIHPWVIYKEKKSIRKSENPEEVIFFPLHTVSGYQVTGMDDEQSINFLKELNEEIGTIKVCLHWNDLGTEREALFKHSGFEVISLGNPMSGEYIRNFYDFAVKTKFVISESWTSGLAFFIDMDIPCMILKRELRIESDSEFNKNVGFANPRIKSDIQHAENLFSDLNPCVTIEQKQFIQNELGYSFRANNAKNFRVIVLLYLTSWPSWIMYQAIQMVKHLIKERFRPYN
jgi:hypothetical protein